MFQKKVRNGWCEIIIQGQALFSQLQTEEIELYKQIIQIIIIQGNQFFAANDYQKALTQYQASLSICEPYYMHSCPPDLQEKFMKLKINLFGNISACYSNLSQYNETITYTTLVLQAEPTNKKALYRRALAYQAKEDFDQAYRDIDAGWNSVKNTTQDRDIFEKRQEIRKQMKEYDLGYSQKSKAIIAQIIRLGTEQVVRISKKQQRICSFVDLQYFQQQTKVMQLDLMITDHYKLRPKRSKDARSISLSPKKRDSHSQKLPPIVSTSKQRKVTSVNSLAKNISRTQEDDLRFDLHNNKSLSKKLSFKNVERIHASSFKNSKEVNFNQRQKESKIKKYLPQKQIYLYAQQQQQQQQSCPFSVNGCIQQFFERNKQRVSTTVRYSEFDHTEKLDRHIKELTEILKQDTLIGPKIGNAHEMKGVVKSVINLAFGHKTFYQYETLRLIHEPLKITDQIFNRFKYLYIHQIMTMKLSIEDVFKCAQTIESFRGAITCSENSVQMIKDCVRDVTREMYTNIWDDFSLRSLFSNTKFDEQIVKFSRIFGFILSTSETTNYVLDSMREFHQGFGITSLQYSTFKFYLSQGLQNHVHAEAVWQVLEQADCYKAAVINQDSINNLVYQQCGIQQFTNDFIKLCQNDPFINKHMYQKMGQEQFLNHTNYFFQYIFNRHNVCFSLHDIQALHQPSLTLKLVQAVKQKMFYLLHCLNPSKVMISDFEEDYDELEPYLTGCPLPCDIVGDQFKSIVQNMCMEIRGDYETLYLYNQNEVNVDSNIERKFSFLLSGRTYFKRSDIQTIHQKLNISNAQFTEFVNKCRRSIIDKSLHWILYLLEQWRPLIINEV